MVLFAISQNCVVLFAISQNCVVLFAVCQNCVVLFAVNNNTANSLGVKIVCAVVSLFIEFASVKSV